VQRSMRKIRKH